MSLPELVALTPGQLGEDDVARALAVAGACLGVGLPGVLLREPRLSDRAWLAFGRGLREACDRSGAWLAVHDRAHLAAAVGADAVHLGFRSLEPDQLERVFASKSTSKPTYEAASPAIGVSCHAGDGPEVWRDADYLFFGPVRATPSKPEGDPGWRPATGFDALSAFTGEVRRPVFALGGMEPDDVAAARAAGAHGLAVLGGVLGHADPVGQTRAFVDALGTGRSGGDQGSQRKRTRHPRGSQKFLC